MTSEKLNLHCLEHRPLVYYSDNQEELSVFIPHLNMDEILDKEQPESYITVSFVYKEYEMWLIQETTKLNHRSYILLATENGNMEGRSNMFEEMYQILHQCGVNFSDTRKKLSLL